MRIASLLITLTTGALLLTSAGCSTTNHAPAPPAPAAGNEVVGTLVALKDDRPVDGGIDLTLETAPGVREVVRVPSVFRVPPREPVLALHAVVDSSKIGDRLHARGTRDETGALQGGVPGTDAALERGDDFVPRYQLELIESSPIAASPCGARPRAGPRTRHGGPPRRDRRCHPRSAHGPRRSECRKPGNERGVPRCRGCRRAPAQAGSGRSGSRRTRGRDWAERRARGPRSWALPRHPPPRARS